MINPPIINITKGSLGIQDKIVLKQVELTVGQGEFVYLIGKTGSGKTTLLKTLYGERPLLGGSGDVAENDLNQITYKNVHLLRRKIGMVFQDFNLLNDRTVFDNLKFVLKATGWKDKFLIDSRIEEVLYQVGMSGAAISMPHELSGGEQQKIVIARALINYPVLILADEPTGNLDPETADEILNLLVTTSQKNNMAIILATHDYRLMSNYEARILETKHGILREKSTSQIISYHL